MPATIEVSVPVPFGNGAGFHESTRWRLRRALLGGEWRLARVRGPFFEQLFGAGLACSAATPSATAVARPAARWIILPERPLASFWPMTVTDMSTLATPRSTFGNQVAAIETGRVLPIGDPVVRRPVNVVEDRAREPPPRELSEIVKIVATAEMHCLSPPALLPDLSLVASPLSVVQKF